MTHKKLIIMNNTKDRQALLNVETMQDIVERLHRLKSLTEEAGCRFPSEMLPTAVILSKTTTERSVLLEESLSMDESSQKDLTDLDLSLSSDESEGPITHSRLAQTVLKLKDKNKEINKQLDRKLSQFKSANSYALFNKEHLVKCSTMVSVDDKPEKIISKIKEIRHEVKCINRKINNRNLQTQSHKIDQEFIQQLNRSFGKQLRIDRNDENTSCSSCSIF